jgi:hypothetical protein
MIWRKQRAVLLLQMSVMSFEGLTLIPAENFKSAEMDFSAIHLEVPGANSMLFVKDTLWICISLGVTTLNKC